MLESRTAVAKRPLAWFIEGALFLLAFTLAIPFLTALSSWQAADRAHWYFSIGAGFTYPLNVIAALLFSRKWPLLVLLPLLHIVLWLLAGYLETLGV